MNLFSSAIRQAGVMLFVFLFFGLGTTSAQTTDCSTGPFLVLNLAGDSEIANKTIAFNEDSENLRPLLDIKAANLLDTFRSLLQQGKGSNRWITKKGTPIAIYIIYNPIDEKVPKLDVTETPRKTLFSTNLETLTKLAKTIGGVGFARVVSPKIEVLRQCRILTNLRATLDATATADALKPEESQTAGSSKVTVTITTGPIEHGFLSADLAVNSIKQLKLESGQLVPKDNPSTFYVGFDYMMGDVLAETSTFPDGLTFKALVEASKDPTNSFGLALGMRFKNVKLPGISLDTFSPFAGYFWTRNDTLTGHKYKGDWRAGISLNLDKALNWVK